MNSGSIEERRLSQASLPFLPRLARGSQKGKGLELAGFEGRRRKAR